MERLTRAREAETKYIREQNELEINKSRDIAAIDTEKFKDMVDAIGADTIKAIATSGPEMQVRCDIQVTLDISCFTAIFSDVHIFLIIDLDYLVIIIYYSLL